MARTDGQGADSARTQARRRPDRLSAPLRPRRRTWIALAGAVLMALAGGLAGGLAGAVIGMDQLAAPDMTGPRLRVSPLGQASP